MLSTAASPGGLAGSGPRGRRREGRSAPAIWGRLPVTSLLRSCSLWLRWKPHRGREERLWGHGLQNGQRQTEGTVGEHPPHTHDNPTLHAGAGRDRPNRPPQKGSGNSSPASRGPGPAPSTCRFRNLQPHLHAPARARPSRNLSDIHGCSQQVTADPRTVPDRSWGAQGEKPAECQPGGLQTGPRARSPEGQDEPIQPERDKRCPGTDSSVPRRPWTEGRAVAVRPAQTGVSLTFSRSWNQAVSREKASFS